MCVDAPQGKVLCRAGQTSQTGERTKETTDALDWVMEEHLHKPLPRSPAATTWYRSHSSSALMMLPENTNHRLRTSLMPTQLGTVLCRATSRLQVRCTVADAGLGLKHRAGTSQTKPPQLKHPTLTSRPRYDADAGYKRAKPLVQKAPITRTMVNPPVTMLMLATQHESCLPMVRSATRQPRFRVWMLLQDITCHLPVSRVRQHAVLVTIKQHPGKYPVMLPTLANWVIVL